MKQYFSRTAAATLACCATATTAWAQASVSVFGIADVAARVVSNEDQGSRKSLVSGAGNTSRLGFRGSEDLGDGWSAGFHLETGVAMDSGTQANSTLFWDRRSTVSLVSKSLGEVRAGRDFVPTYTVWVRHDPFAYVGVAASSILLGASPTGPATGLGSPPTLRSSNQVQYILPSTLGGVDGALMVAAGEGGKASDGFHKIIAGRLAYTVGPVSVSGGYQTVENDLSKGEKFKDSVLGVRYDLGEGKVSLARREFKYLDAKQTVWMLSGAMAFGAHEVKASVLRANVAGKVGTANIDANDATHVGLGYVYNLSKRTALYSTVARIHNQAKANFEISGGPAVAAGKASTGFEGGMRHSF